jgi:hypothetical protein
MLTSGAPTESRKQELHGFEQKGYIKLNRVQNVQNM